MANARGTRPQMERIKWPLDSRQVETIDNQLEELFKRVRQLRTAVDTSSSSTDSTPGVSSGWVAFVKDLGVAGRSGHFDIVASGFSVGARVLIHQTAFAIPSKGGAQDEPEMDSITATGYVVDASTIRVYWHASGVIVGDVAFVFTTLR